MNREIKFRAWDKEHKKMHQVEELSFGKDGLIHGLLSKEGGKELGRVYLGEETLVDVGNKNHPEGWIDDYPLVQYTGLKDKNGEEIYEGDIVKVVCVCGHIENLPVKGKDGYNGYYLEAKYQHNWSDDQLRLIRPERDYEVIGNIYENPELLKEVT